MWRPGELPKRPKGSDCKSAGVAFGGSNPSLATMCNVPGHRERANPRRAWVKLFHRLPNPCDSATQSAGVRLSSAVPPEKAKDYTR